MQDEMELYESGDSLKKGDSDQIVKTPDNKNFILNKDSESFIFTTPGIYTLKQNNNSIDIYVNPPYLELFHEKIDLELSDLKKARTTGNFLDLSRIIVFGGNTTFKR